MSLSRFHPSARSHRRAASGWSSFVPTPRRSNEKGFEMKGAPAVPGWSLFVSRSRFHHFSRFHPWAASGWISFVSLPIFTVRQLRNKILYYSFTCLTPFPGDAVRRLLVAPLSCYFLGSSYPGSTGRLPVGHLSQANSSWALVRGLRSCSFFHFHSSFRFNSVWPPIF